jgi:hypothetical protein
MELVELLRANIRSSAAWSYLRILSYYKRLGYMELVEILLSYYKSLSYMELTYF